MHLESLRTFLLWCTIINYAILVLWFAAFILAHDFLYRIHTKWFKLSPDSFDSMHYGGMSVYKIGIMLFNLVPLIVLYILY
ncbi:MAG TPA: hypothetical protein VGQ55_07945 [Pyrinomonadaceae bacterium]|jgi:hypothetical protein|nr:hypothetical protein [Pyrinomonadaceae bacterium]